MPRAPDWDAASYHRVAAPHAAWGANVLDRLTQGGRVIAADQSPAMLEEARSTLQPFAGFMQAADAVVSKEPYAASLSGKALWRFFYSPEETQARLFNAGFSAAEAWLEPSPQTFAHRQALADFCRTVVLSSHLAALPEPLRQPCLDAVVNEIARRHGGLVLDYVHLNVQAAA